MKIIFAQGNPGRQYQKTRHNIGFMALDELASQNSSKWSEKPKFKAEIVEINGTDKIILVKPNTFYNQTGESLKMIADFYKANPAQDLLVIHDDLALPFGTIRIRASGNDAGNNGVRSINQQLGPEYHRVRVGIDNDLRPKMGDSDFVLAKFSREEKAKLKKIILPQIIAITNDFIENKLNITSQTL